MKTTMDGLTIVKTLHQEGFSIEDVFNALFNNGFRVYIDKSRQPDIYFYTTKKSGGPGDSEITFAGGYKSLPCIKW